MNLKLITLIAVAGIAGALSSPTTTPQAADEAIVKFVAEEVATQAEKDLSSYRPQSDHACECDCPTASEIRSIVREELAAFKSEFAAKYEPPQPNATRPSGSTGGTLSSVSGTKGQVISRVVRSVPASSTVVCENGTCRVVSGTQSRTTSNVRRWTPVRNLFRR